MHSTIPNVLRVAAFGAIVRAWHAKMDSRIARRIKRKLKKIHQNYGILIAGTLLTIIGVALHTRLYLSNFGQRVEIAQTDLWFRLRGLASPPSEVIMVRLDKANPKITQGPQSQGERRKIIAATLRTLAASGASLAVLDFIFRDQTSDWEADRELAGALGSMPTVIGSFRYVEDSGEENKMGLTEVKPLEMFSKRALGVASMDIYETDKVRHFAVAIPSGQYQPPFTRALVAYAHKTEVPNDRDLINYYGPAGSFPQVSAREVIDGTAVTNQNLFGGKVVLFGNAPLSDSAEASKDSFPIPAGARLSSGVEIHATTAANILRGDWIRRFPPAGELIALNMLVTVWAFVAVVISPRQSVLALIGIAAIWSVSAYVGFTCFRFIPGVVLVVFVMPVITLLAIAGKHRWLSRQYQLFTDSLGTRRN